MQLTFSAATAGSVGRAQTRMCAAGLLANGAYGIADGADRIDLFPHRSFRGTQLKVALERARVNKGYDKDREKGGRGESRWERSSARRGRASNRMAAMAGVVEPFGRSRRLSAHLEEPWPRRPGEPPANIPGQVFPGQAFLILPIAGAGRIKVFPRIESMIRKSV
jgi:hypothetical protein